MSKNENGLKIEEADIGIKQQKKKDKYIEDEAIVQILMQHTPRKDIDFSKFKIPSYLNLDEEEIEENQRQKL